MKYYDAVLHQCYAKADKERLDSALYVHYYNVLCKFPVIGVNLCISNYNYRSSVEKNRIITLSVKHNAKELCSC